MKVVQQIVKTNQQQEKYLMSRELVLFLNVLQKVHALILWIFLLLNEGYAPYSMEKIGFLHQRD